MTSYEPSPYGPDANNGASSRSNPYQKPSSLSDNSASEKNTHKPESDFFDDITNVFTEAKESITSAFNEMRSESTKSADQKREGASLSDDSTTSFDDIKKQFKEMWASRPVRLPADQGGGGKIPRRSGFRGGLSQRQHPLYRRRRIRIRRGNRDFHPKTACARAVGSAAADLGQI